MAGQLDQWFKLADEDHDGMISGGEAVRFFTKSGLPQPTLGTIWEMASGGKPSLNQQQFAIALKLVSLAQASRGMLNPDQARAVVMGGGPPLPLPTLAGVNAPAMPAYNPQVTGAPGPYAPQMTGPPGYRPQMTAGYMGPGAPPTGAAPPGGYMPQMTGPQGAAGPRPGAMPGQPTGPYGMQQPTGGMPPGSAPMQPGMTAAPGGYRPQMTGPVPQQMPGGPAAAGATGMPPGAPAAAGYTGMPPAVTGGMPGAYPLATPTDMQRYQAMFMQLDTDRDGFVKGTECMQPFMAWGLDKATLKRIWDLVAGTAAQLSQVQFTQAVYLMDAAKRGLPLPPVLPPGQFPPMAGGPGSAGGAPSVPPVAGGITGALPADSFAMPESPVHRQDTWSLSSQFGQKTATKAINEAYDQTLPRLPDMPGKFTYDPKTRPAAGAGPAVPALDDAVANMLAPVDKAKYDEATATAAQRAAAVAQQEAEAAGAKHRLEQFQEALSELMLFKSRTDVILLQAQDQTMRLEREAAETERRYTSAHDAAQNQFEASKAAREALQALLQRKQEAVLKLDLLNQELAMLANFSPEQMAALETEVGGMVAQVAAAQAQKAAYDMQLDSGKKQKTLLADKMADLQLASAAGEAELGRLRADLSVLVKDVVAAKAAGVDIELADVTELLKKAAAAYRSLYSSASAAGFDIPYEANLANLGGLVWVEQMMAGTADWLDAEDDPEAAGYVMVNALPDLEGVPPSVKRAASRAMATAAPAMIKPVGAALVTPRSSTAGDVVQQAAEEHKAPGVPMRRPSGSGGGAAKGAAAVETKEAGTPTAAAAAAKEGDHNTPTEAAAATQRGSGTGESQSVAAAAAEGPGAEAPLPEVAAKAAAVAGDAISTPAAASGGKGGSTPKAAVTAAGMGAAAGAAAAATAAVAAAGAAASTPDTAVESAAVEAPAPEAVVPQTAAAETKIGGGFEDDAFDSYPGAARARTHSMDSSAAADLPPAAGDLPSEVHSEVPDEAAAMWTHEGRTPSGRPAEVLGDGGLVSDDSSLVSGYRPSAGGGHGLSTQLTGRTSIASSGYEEDQGLSVLQQQLVGDLQRVYGGVAPGASAGPVAAGAVAAAAGAEEPPAAKQSMGGFEDNAF